MLPLKRPPPNSLWQCECSCNLTSEGLGPVPALVRAKTNYFKHHTVHLTMTIYIYTQYKYTCTNYRYISCVCKMGTEILVRYTVPSFSVRASCHEPKIPSAAQISVACESASPQGLIPVSNLQRICQITASLLFLLLSISLALSLSLSLHSLHL